MRNQLAFDTGLFLKDNLPEPFPIVESRGQQDLAQEVQQVVDMGRGALVAKDKQRQSEAGIDSQRIDRRRADPPGFSPDALGQGDEVLLFGSHLEQRGAEQTQVRREVCGDAAGIKREIQVNDSMGWKLVIQNAGVRVDVDLGRDRLDQRLKVTRPQRRYHSQRFRAVRRGLQGLQRCGVRGEPLQLLGAEIGCNLIQSTLFRLFPLGQPSIVG